MNSKIVATLKFELVEAIIITCDEFGNLIEYAPQSRYAKKETSRLNPNGEGTFCKFKLTSAIDPQTTGVYTLFSNQELIYIGQCSDLKKRFNAGYGNISPKNCYDGGQSTNCKINKEILRLTKENNTCSLYFYKTDKNIEVEKILINELKPKLNAK